jgi:hypothetical protein
MWEPRRPVTGIALFYFYAAQLIRYAHVIHFLCAARNERGPSPPSVHRPVRKDFTYTGQHKPSSRGTEIDLAYSVYAKYEALFGFVLHSE